MTNPTEEDLNDDENAIRRSEELEALQSVYGEDAITTTTSSSDEKTIIWQIQIKSQIILEIQLSPEYPSTSTPPKASIKTTCPWKITLDQTSIKSTIEEMMELHSPDMEVAILWAEHCRAAFEMMDTNDVEQNDKDDKEQQEEELTEKTEEGIQTFIPPTSKYSQPIRHFQTAVIQNPSNARTIHKGSPFHPPKSGPSETMLAHVASVHSLNHVHWVLARLLFQDKKVGKATHNMFAYKFYSEETNTMHKDNDDDGEKGSGAKLASLLDMTDVNNVIVVVSRWYGGVKLGPSRFKWIAMVGRDALEDAGFIQKR